MHMVKFSEVKGLCDASTLFLWSTGNSKGKKLPLASQALFLADLAPEIKISTVKDFFLLDVSPLQK